MCSQATSVAMRARNTPKAERGFLEACDERIYTGLPTKSKRVVDASAGSAERNVVERALASDTCVALHVRQSQRHERQITGLPNPETSNERRDCEDEWDLGA